MEKDEALKLYDSLRSQRTDGIQTQTDQSNAKERRKYSSILLDRKKTIKLSLVILMLVALGAYYFLLQ